MSRYVLLVWACEGLLLTPEHVVGPYQSYERAVMEQDRWDRLDGEDGSPLFKTEIAPLGYGSAEIRNYRRAARPRSRRTG